MRLQPPPSTVAAPTTYGCSLERLRLQVRASFLALLKEAYTTTQLKVAALKSSPAIWQVLTPPLALTLTLKLALTLNLP